MAITRVQLFPIFLPPYLLSYLRAMFPTHVAHGKRQEGFRPSCENRIHHTHFRRSSCFLRFVIFHVISGQNERGSAGAIVGYTYLILLPLTFDRLLPKLFQPRPP